MKVTFLEKSYIAVLGIIFAGIVVHAPLSVWLGTTFPNYDLVIKSWKEVLLLVAACLAVTIVTQRKIWGSIFRDWLLRLIFLYSILHFILAIIFFQETVTIFAGLAIDLRYVIFFGLVYIALKLLPGYRRAMLQIVAIGAGCVVGFAILQLFLPADILSHIGYGKDTIMPYLLVDQNPDFVRVNSTLRGPNPLGAYAVIVLSLIAAVVMYKKIDLKNKKIQLATSLFALFAFVALWISYSRSALVAAAGAIGIILIVAMRRKLSPALWISGAIVTLVAIGGFILAKDSSFVSNVILHDNPTTGGAITSNEQHASSLEEGFDRMLRQPIGAGIGSTGSASLHGDQPIVIENQYLFIAHEVGWLGLGLFLAIFITILYHLWRAKGEWLSLAVFASGVGLGLIGLLQPVWVDDTVSIIWWGLAAIALAGKGMYDRKKSK